MADPEVEVRSSVDRDIPADPLDGSFPEISAIDFLYQCIIHHNL